MVVGRWVLAMLLGAWGLQASAQRIFTCVDAKGRRITADRPIAECMDREQQELGPSGMVRNRIGPALTAAERAEQEEQARRIVEERQRAADERRRDAALVTRYPHRASHDQERKASLALVDDVIASGEKRVAELLLQHRTLEQQAAQAGQDPMRLTPIRRQLEQNEQLLAAQKRVVADKQAERRRIDKRFDEELAKLQRLWEERTGSAPPGAASASR